MHHLRGHNMHIQWNPAGHPSTADTHDITDNSESPDHFFIDFNTLETPE